MTRADREHLLQRYLEGTMSSAEEEEFLIRAALNTDLRMELKAHQTIDRALRKDRTAGTVEHTALRARVAANLSANPVPAETISVPSAPPSAITTGVPAAVSTTAPTSFGIWGGSALLGALGLIATLVLTLRPFDSAAPEPVVRPANTVVAPAPSIPPALLPGTTVDPAESGVRGTSPAPSAVVRERQGTARTAVGDARKSRQQMGATANRAAGGENGKSSTVPNRSTRSAEPVDVKAKVSIETNINGSKNDQR